MNSQLYVAFDYVAITEGHGAGGVRGLLKEEQAADLYEQFLVLFRNLERYVIVVFRKEFAEGGIDLDFHCTPHVMADAVAVGCKIADRACPELIDGFGFGSHDSLMYSETALNATDIFSTAKSKPWR